MKTTKLSYLILVLAALEGFTVSYIGDILVPLQTVIQEEFNINMT